MNRIKGASCSGEGGEDANRFKIMDSGDSANSRVKQIASARFGVTVNYLNNCNEIEIKIAQGAKPGEGGQLPGYKAGFSRSLWPVAGCSSPDRVFLPTPLPDGQW